MKYLAYGLLAAGVVVTLLILLWPTSPDRSSRTAAESPLALPTFSEAPDPGKVARLTNPFSGDGPLASFDPTATASVVDPKVRQENECDRLKALIDGMDFNLKTASQFANLHQESMSWAITAFSRYGACEALKAHSPEPCAAFGKNQKGGGKTHRACVLEWMVIEYYIYQHLILGKPMTQVQKEAEKDLKAKLGDKYNNIQTLFFTVMDMAVHNSATYCEETFKDSRFNRIICNAVVSRDRKRCDEIRVGEVNYYCNVASSLMDAYEAARTGFQNLNEVSWSPNIRFASELCDLRTSHRVDCAEVFKEWLYQKCELRLNY